METDLDTIAKEALIKHTSGYQLRKQESPKLEVGGIYQWKQRGEEHLFNPATIHLLQQATKQNDYSVYKKLLKLRTHGITKNPDELLENDGPWYYEMHELGYNYRITDFQSALGSSQLKKLNFF